MDTTAKASEKQRIMFLYLNTGGGHISACRALARDIESRYSPEEVELHIVNGLGDGPSISHALVENGYTVVSSQIPFLWPICYNLGSYLPFMAYQVNFMRLSSTKVIAEYIEKHQITKVVVLHFLMIAPLRSALLRLGKCKIPAITIATDPFTIHNMWTFRQFMPMIVFSEAGRRRVMHRLPRLALKTGKKTRVEPSVTIMPPILAKRFAAALSDEANRRNREALGFSTDKPLILLAGGGDGLPEGELYLTALGIAKLDIQVAMVCGKNRAQLDVATVIAKLNPRKNIKVYGFVNNMYELMNMADIIVAKGGPATVFEALALRKPLVIIKHLYGQEKGNVNFVVHHGLGWYEPRPILLVRRLTQLLEQPETFNEVRHRLEKVKVGIGTQQIADYIMNLKPPSES